MKFYELSKEQRQQLTKEISAGLQRSIETGSLAGAIAYCSNDDTYIRKAAYEAIGKLWLLQPDLQENILTALQQLLLSDNEKIRQTCINAAGEIGKSEFGIVVQFFERGLFDPHPVIRNAVIGSIKKMSEKNPGPVLAWSKKYLHHKDKEIRREICHGIELRGRTHPEDILPLLKELEFDSTARVRNTLVHVLGQIAYKKGCLQTVVAHLKTWSNQELVFRALAEIVDVHKRYADFAVLSAEDAARYIEEHFEVP
jgi:HEAT repeat protein